MTNPQGGMLPECAREFGFIGAKLDSVLANQETHGRKLDGIESRVGGLEVKGVRSNMVSGGIMGVGAALLTEFVKNKLGFGA